MQVLIEGSWYVDIRFNDMFQIQSHVNNIWLYVTLCGKLTYMLNGLSDIHISVILKWHICHGH